MLNLVPDNMTEVLDKAASSADQAVRNMAIRYREMRMEFKQYEAFFTIYKKGVESNGTAARIVPRTAPRGRPPAAKSARVPSKMSDKVNGFGVSLQALLAEVGRPMQLDELYLVYSEKHPEDPTEKETFRQRLVKLRQRETITLIKGQGYWWGDSDSVLPPPDPMDAGTGDV
jgi:hypothetical protein